MPPYIENLIVSFLLIAAGSFHFVMALVDNDIADLSFTLDYKLTGEALAFADFNADGLLDLLTLVEHRYGNNASMQELRLNMWRKDATPYEYGLLTSEALTQKDAGRSSVRIEGAAVADFNGDALADILLSVREGQADTLTIWVAYGNDPNGQTVSNVSMVTAATDQPTLLDFNADLVTDFMVELPGLVGLVVFTGQDDESRFRYVNASGMLPVLSKLTKPNGNLYTDLTSDLRADLLLGLIGNDSQPTFALLSRGTGLSFERAPDFPPLPQVELPGFVYGLLEPLSGGEADARLGLAIPACVLQVFRDFAGSPAEWRCGNASSQLWLYSSRAAGWCLATVDGLGDRYSWHPEYPVAAFGRPILRVRAADLDLDSRPDLLATLRRHTDNQPVAAVLRWLTNSGCAGYRLAVEELSVIACPKTAVDSVNGDWQLVSLAPTEINGDGSPDLVTICRQYSGGGSASGGRVLRDSASLVHYQVHDQPGNFFRLQVLTSGHCAGPGAKSCQHARLPQGLPAPGPCVRFTTEPPEGGSRADMNCQLGQSTAYGRLPLPSMHFGLGQYSNYLEQVVVAIPYLEAASPRQRDFSFIVPNCDMLVSPYPPDNVDKWHTWLIIRPFSHPHVWGVGLVLLIACIFAFCIAASIQYSEWHKDRAERAADGIMFDPSR